MQPSALPRILLVASEAVPFAKTGGLGDVITPLAAALQRCGADVSLLLPAYRPALRAARALQEVALLGDLPGGPGLLLHTRHGKLNVLLLSTERFAGSESLYVDAQGREYEDTALRFADLAHAAERICSGLTPLPPPQVVHLHDWHTALVPAIQQARGGRRTPSVLTIHNLAFQGLCAMEQARQLSLGGEAALQAQGEFWGRFSFLKCGIVSVDKITTVSRSYAEEILTTRFGCGLEGVLRARQTDLVAVANGIDAALWSPRTDTLLPERFSAARMAGKAVCKQELQRRFGLPPEPKAPLLALGSRLAHQKMADVAADALPLALAREPRLQVAVLGCGDAQYEARFRRLADDFPGRVGARISYEERLAHLLHAGADLLLHGSRFEPFGLTPLYAMRYGTVPIASRVGGIKDTIVDVGDPAVPNVRGSGVLFEGEASQDMLAAIERGLAVFFDPAVSRLMQRNGMAADFGWDGPAAAFYALYRGLAAPHDRGLFDADASPSRPVAAGGALRAMGG